MYGEYHIPRSLAGRTSTARAVPKSLSLYVSGDLYQTTLQGSTFSIAFYNIVIDAVAIQVPTPTFCACFGLLKAKFAAALSRQARAGAGLSDCGGRASCWANDIDLRFVGWSLVQKIAGLPNRCCVQLLFLTILAPEHVKSDLGWVVAQEPPADIDAVGHGLGDDAPAHRLNHPRFCKSLNWRRSWHWRRAVEACQCQVVNQLAGARAVHSHINFINAPGCASELAIPAPDIAAFRPIRHLAIFLADDADGRLSANDRLAPSVRR